MPVRALRDTTHALDDGLAAIRTQFKVPAGFPAPVEQAAAAAATRAPSAHRDLTEWPFVTLDPAGSRDLDQAFHLEPAGDDLLLHYAIADVAWFVDDGGPIDAEAWARGLTLYLPDGRAGLYPPVLSEGAASLLPDGPRPAVVFHVRVDPHGAVRLDGATRAVVRSRAKLAYATVTDADLPTGFAEFARRIDAAGAARGASRADPPEQVVERDDGGYRLAFRPRLASEDANAALSLACNLAVADALEAAHTGLFRVMAGPDERAMRRLRHTARALELHWPEEQTLDAFVRGLDANSPVHAAFLMAVRRVGGGASYVPYRDGVVPWHAALAATYSHATAPLRRLADRYTVMTALAVANGEPVPEHVAAALERLPDVMERAESKAGGIDRAVVDLAEAVMLHGHEGDTFAAVVVDEDDQGSRIQLRDVAVVARVVAHRVQPGDEITVRLTEADPAKRAVRFERVN